MPIPLRLRLPILSDDLVRQMLELCQQIERALESPSQATSLLRRWNQHATRNYELSEFRHFWKAISEETFVREALTPRPMFDVDLHYAEALAVLECVCEASLPETQLAYYLDWLEAQFPQSNVSDLIYWPDEWFQDPALFREPSGAFKPEAELSRDQLLAYAMARSARTLPGAPANVPMPFSLPRN